MGGLPNNLLFVGDLHLTDNQRDLHRFKIFDWIKRQQEKHSVAATFLAGDLTDAKDRHSATLVNKTVTGLAGLRTPLYIDRGNHDYRDPENPFFNFLNTVDGISFVTKPINYFGIGIIPHYRTQSEFDDAVKMVGSAKSYLVHQTFQGAIAETGAILNGLSASLIESFKPPLGVLAGDVHRPQTQGIVRYIGCPYHVRFGDSFTPRVLLLKNGAFKNLYFDAPFKHSLIIRDADDILNNNDLAKGDQVKITLELPREEVVEWKAIKADCLAACKELGLEVYGFKLDVKTTKPRNKVQAEGKPTADIFEQFCKHESVASEIKKAGERIMKDDH